MPARPHIDEAVRAAMAAAGAMHDAAAALAERGEIPVGEMASILGRLQSGWETVGALGAYSDEAVADAAARGWPGVMPADLQVLIAGAHVAGAALVGRVLGSGCDPAVVPAYGWAPSGKPLARNLSSGDLSILRAEASALRDALAWAAA